MITLYTYHYGRTYGLRQCVRVCNIVDTDIYIYEPPYTYNWRSGCSLRRQQV